MVLQFERFLLASATFSRASKIDSMVDLFGKKQQGEKPTNAEGSDENFSKKKNKGSIIVAVPQNRVGG